LTLFEESFYSPQLHKEDSVAVDGVASIEWLMGLPGFDCNTQAAPHRATITPKVIQLLVQD
jgi:hypothetical protein